MARGADRARRFQAELFRSAFDDGSVVLAAVNGADPIGFAWLTSSDHSEVPSLGRVAAMAVRAMGVAGALAAAWPAASRRAVDLSPPPGGAHLTELHVHPNHRGEGIGGALLDAVEGAARSQGAPHLSLTTGSSNPARHLYERHGFEVVAERASHRYTRLTGIPGRVLMVKSL